MRKAPSFMAALTRRWKMPPPTAYQVPTASCGNEKVAPPARCWSRPACGGCSVRAPPGCRRTCWRRRRGRRPYCQLPFTPTRQRRGRPGRWRQSPIALLPAASMPATGRGAGVDVGGPGVEGHGGDLEAEPRDEHRDGDEAEGVEGAVRLDVRREGRDAGRARHAVQEADGEQHEAAGDGADDEVLQAGLGPDAVAAEARPTWLAQTRSSRCRGSSVKSSCCRGDDHHAEDGEQDQAVELAEILLGAALEGTAEAEDGKESDGEEDELEELARVRDDEGAVQVAALVLEREAEAGCRMLVVAEEAPEP